MSIALAASLGEFSHHLSYYGNGYGYGGGDGDGGGYGS